MSLDSTGNQNQIQLPKNDVRLEMRIKNNILYTAIMSKHGSVNAFCEHAQENGYTMTPSRVGDLMNFKMSPFVHGDPSEFKPICLDIERLLGIPAEDLFPAKLYQKLGVNKEIIVFNSSDGPIALASRQPHLIPAGLDVHPEVRVVSHELRERLEEVVKTLTYREREIVKLYFGLGDGYCYTLEECGKIFKCTRERVQQVLNKAIKNLQRPSRAKKLLDFAPEETPKHRCEREAREAEARQKRIERLEKARKKMAELRERRQQDKTQQDQAGQ